MAQLVIKKSEESGRVLLTMNGHIDEDVDFSSIDCDKDKSIILDLNGINSVNSCGIRDWIKWISSLRGVEEIIFRRCPKVIVDQMNMVDGFLPANGTVESFFVPYYSERTGEEKFVLFTSGKEFNGSQMMLPPNVVDREGANMEMDILEAKYFRFLMKK